MVTVGICGKSPYFLDRGDGKTTLLLRFVLVWPGIVVDSVFGMTMVGDCYCSDTCDWSRCVRRQPRLRHDQRVIPMLVVCSKLVP